MRTSSKLGLRIWNLLLDPYDHEQLADNWAKVDAHDHSPGRGVLIPTEGIAKEAIIGELIAKETLINENLSADLKAELVPGAWTTLESVNASLKAVASFATPEVRVEQNGARAYLCGVYEVTAEIITGAALFTVPLAMRPKTKTDYGAQTIVPAAANQMSIATTGVVLSATLPKDAFLLLEGVNWRLT
jgi:hypothetical protein